MQREDLLMPVKDTIHVLKCKYCGKRYTMFDTPDRGLVYYPDNVMWPTHGNLELVDHMRMNHQHEHEMYILFNNYDRDEYVKAHYEVVQ